MNVIFGSAGFAKEVDWLLYEINLQKGESYFLDWYVGNESNQKDIQGVPVVSESDFCSTEFEHQVIEGFIAIANPVIRKKIWDKFKNLPQFTFPTLVHPNVCYDARLTRIEIGKGSIICSGAKLTTDIKIGSFVHVNLNATIGHDSQIGDFCTISPGCNISGNVTIGNGVFLGTNAVILEKLIIANNVIVGAGSVVTKSITEPGTYVGIPAKKIK